MITDYQTNDMTSNSRSSSIWNNFYQTYGRSLARTAEPDVWYPVVKQALRQNDFVVPFFALARYEASCGEPLVIREDDSKTCVGGIANKFGFDYGVFRRNKDRLSDQLSSFRVNLIEAGNGKQYLRTIHRLSGAVYLKAAKIAVGIPSEKWIVNNDLHPLISEEARKYLNRNEGDDGLMSDVRVFFGKLQSAYQFCNETPSFESCRDLSPELSDRMLKSILNKLSWDDRQTINGRQTTANPFLPSFRINGNGVVEFGFPRASILAAAEHPAATTVVFGFRTRNGRRPVYVRFCKNGDNWNPEVDSVLGFPPGDVLSVLRIEYDANSTPLSEQDVTPSILADPENSHLLVDSVGRPIDTKSSVMAGCTYRIVWLHGHVPAHVTAFDDEGGEIQVEAGMSSFSVPVRSAVIRIGEVDRAVQTNANVWLNLAGSFRNVCRAQGRVFFESGTFPFSSDFVESGQAVQYRKTDGSVVKIEEDASWREPPEDILWNRGWIEFVCAETETILAKRAVTFLPKIDSTELKGPFELQGVPDRYVRFDDGSREVSVPVRIPDATDSAAGNFVEVPLKDGFCLRYPVFRHGITVSFPGTTVEPFVLSPERPVVLANDDFENVKFHFSGIRSASVCRGVTVYLDLGEKRAFSLDDLLDRCGLRKETSDDWSFFADGEFAGRLSVYRPEQTPWDNLSDHPAVGLEKNGDELVVRFWLARRSMDEDLFLTGIPAHRQDDRTKRKRLVCARENREFDNANGRLRAILHFPGFYSQSDIRDDFGAGLLSFITIQDKNDPDGFSPVSAGFSIKRPDEWGAWSLSSQDDPYGLRRAMAVCDLPAIERIMMSQDPECRNWIRDFEKNTLETLSSFGLSNLDFFHAYRSEIVKENGSIEPSGYFFMAGWLLQDKMVFSEIVGGAPSQRMKTSYFGKWSSLLRAFAPCETDPDATQWKQFSRNMNVRNNENGEFKAVWPFGGTFADVVERNEANPPAFQTLVDLKMIRKRLGQLIKDVDSYWNSVASDVRFDPRRDDATFDSGDPENKPTPLQGTKFTSVDIETCLSRLAKRVSEWRKDPSIESAQRLRDLLLCVEEIDDDLRNKLSSRRDQLPARTMTQRIAMKSWLFD